jgi:hypothetical protein
MPAYPSARSKTAFVTAPTPRPCVVREAVKQDDRRSPCLAALLVSNLRRNVDTLFVPRPAVETLIRGYVPIPFAVLALATPFDYLA